MNRSRMLQGLLSVPKFPYPTDGLVSYWKLDEDPAIHNTTIADSFGSNNGTLITNDGSTNKSVAGQVDKAIEFDGTDDYVDVGNQSDLNPSGALTVSLWVNVNTFRNYNRLVEWGDTRGGDGSDSDGSYGITIDASKKLYWLIVFDTSNKNSVITDSAFNVDSWYHITGTYDGAVQRLYVDAVLQASESISDTIKQTTGGLHIGSILGTAEYLDGSINDLLFYNRALSLSEIEQIYNYGA